MMPQFRKKPVVIEAVEFREDNWDELYAFLGWKWEEYREGDPAPDALHIDTLEGQMCAIRGDWIIKGVQGEFYPCKPAIFASSYEAA